MIKIRVKTTWHNQVGIRDKYLAQAEREKTGLSITVGNERMDIPYEEIEKSIAGRSKMPVVDKFGGHSHFLFYFEWKPIKEGQNLKLI